MPGMRPGNGGNFPGARAERKWILRKE